MFRFGLVLGKINKNMAALAFRPNNTDEKAHPEEKGEVKASATHQTAEAVGEHNAHAAKGHGDDHGGGEVAHAEHGDGHGHVQHDMSTVEGRKSFFFDPDHLVAHVQDQTYFEIPSGDGAHPVHLDIPQVSPWTREEPLIPAPSGELSKFIGPTSFQPTKFVVLELLAAILIAAVVIPYARRVKSGDRPKGKFWNMIDVVVCYVKSEIAEPAIGKSDAKRFLPLLWTIFFFVLVLNLFGMVPGVGSATGAITVTAALAFVVFLVVVGSGSKKMGLVGFWKAQVPHMELPALLQPILIPMIWAIEVFGLFLKHVVLAIRLFANMFAGHLVLAVFVAFIGAFGYVSAVAVGPATLAVSMLELMVAFIQAYVFTFLSALFIGAAVHPH